MTGPPNETGLEDNVTQGSPVALTYDIASERGNPRHYFDLDAVLGEAWAHLREGVSNSRSAFHTPAIATVTEDGLPSIRTVVLRRCDEGLCEIAFHTDRRSPKFCQLISHAGFAAHFYDPAAKCQLRLKCLARIHENDEVARAAWERSRPMSRDCYGQMIAPGAALAAPEAAEADWLSEADGFANFAVVLGQVQRLEWLYLAASGHRRALFEWSGSQLAKSWLAP